MCPNDDGVDDELFAIHQLDPSSQYRRNKNKDHRVHGASYRPLPSVPSRAGANPIQFFNFFQFPFASRLTPSRVNDSRLSTRIGFEFVR